MPTHIEREYHPQTGRGPERNGTLIVGPYFSEKTCFILKICVTDNDMFPITKSPDQ